MVYVYGICIWYTYMVYVYGICIWYMYMVTRRWDPRPKAGPTGPRLVTIYIYHIHIPYTYAIYICHIHIPYTYTIYIYHIHIPYTYTIIQISDHLFHKHHILTSNNIQNAVWGIINTRHPKIMKLYFVHTARYISDRLRKSKPRTKF